MSFDPKKVCSLQVWLNIIEVFLRNVPIDNDVPVPGAEDKKETWEQFRLDALQAMEITQYVLVGNRIPDPCPGKIIRRYVELDKIKFKK